MTLLLILVALQAHLLLCGAASDDVDINYKLTGYNDCAKLGYDVSKIKDGFKEMINMIGRDERLPEPGRKYPPIDWNSAAAVEFWGPAEKSKSWRNDIKGNMDNAASITSQSSWNPFAPKINVRCDDPLHKCTCKPGEGTTTAYVVAQKPVINFCPHYFELPSLGEKTKELKTKPGEEAYIMNFYHSRPVVWAHEVMHIRDIGKGVDSYSAVIDVPVRDYPKVDPPDYRHPDAATPAYGEIFAKWTAQAETYLGSEAADNADNYALFFLANYIQRTKGWYPSKFQVQLDPLEPTPQTSSGEASTPPHHDQRNPFYYHIYCYSTLGSEAPNPESNAQAKNNKPEPPSTPSAPSDICSENLYRNPPECRRNCNGGQCSPGPGELGSTCKCPDPPEPEGKMCKPGKYDDIDKCSEQCFQGTCNQRAGEEGVMCDCP